MKLREQLIGFEGRVTQTYPDPISKGGEPWTIGVGHCGPEVRPGLVWTDAQIDAALDADIAKATAAVDSALPWAKALTEPRRAVLIGMAFQMGIGGLKGFKLTLAAVRDGRYSHAAALMLNSLWAKQTPKRAKTLARQMETGEWQ